MTVASLRHPVSMPLACGVTLAALCASAWAQQPAQGVKPPLAQAWIDVATGAGFGMPAGGMGAGAGGGGNPMAMVGGLFGRGGGAGGNSFGRTQSLPAGRWVDTTLLTRSNPQLGEAVQAVPAGFMSPSLQLRAPQDTRGPAPEPNEEVVEPDQPRPQGRMLLYWGCGEAVRPGQPRVVDFATASPADLGRFFQSRRATQRGAHAAAGRPLWPNPSDPRLVPDGASLVGTHAFNGTGVPEGFRFQIGAAQDLMPPIALKQQQESNGATRLEWTALPTARAYFIAGMGSRGEGEMVIWTSSEQPDIGFGLLDYQTNASVDRWLKEQVLLAPQTTRCSVPKGVFPSEGAMLRMIAYGTELNLVHPPRPTDPKVSWEPQWAVKVRVKSQTTAMLGMEMPSMPEPSAASTEKREDPSRPKEPALPGVKDVLKGIFGR